MLLELGHDGLQPLLEVAAIARAGQQRAHVERVDRGPREHGRHLALGDLAGETLGDGGLADAGVADQQRVVLAPAAEDLDRALDLVLAPDQRIDVALVRLLVEVDSSTSPARSRGSPTGSGRGLPGPRRIPRLPRRRPAPGGLAELGVLGDAVGDEVDRVVAGHVLLLQEVGGVRLALREDRDQHVRARHLGAARGLDVDRGTLDHALERGGRHRLGAFDVGDQGGEVVLDEVLDRLAKVDEVDAAGLHDAGRVRLLDQHEEQMLQGRQLVTAGVGLRQGRMDGLFKGIRERGHGVLLQPADGHGSVTAFL